MTEPMSPFGGTAVATPPSTEMAPPGDLAGGADSRRKLLLVGAVVAVLVLAVAAYFLLVKGNSSTASQVTTVSSGHTAAAPGHGSKAHAAQHGSKGVTLPGVAKKPAGRNPFEALVNPPSTATGSTQSSSTSGSSTGTAGSTTGTTAGSTTGSTTTASGSTTAAGTGTTSTTPGGSTTTPPIATPQSLQLDRLSGHYATFTVHYSDGTTQTYRHIRTGHMFASTFTFVKVITVHRRPYALVQYGDGTPFAQHQGANNRRHI